MYYQTVTNCSRGLLQLRRLRQACHVSHMFTDKQDGSPGNIGQQHSCRLLIVGGGTAGCILASQCWQLAGYNRCVIVEPSETHYCQSLFTLVGAGLARMADARRETATLLPPEVPWLRDEVIAFEPQRNCVRTRSGRVIDYDVMVVALGLRTMYHQIPGLVEALGKAGTGVCSNYSPLYAEHTLDTLKRLEEGNCIFTCPSTHVKGPTAPVEAAFLTDNYMRKHMRLLGPCVTYVTGRDSVLGPKEHKSALQVLMEKRDMNVRLGCDLVAVRPNERQAVFQVAGSCVQETMDYGLLHVTPPQCCPNALARNPLLCDAAGLLEVDYETLQHARYPNVFGIGDCISAPSAKTATAVAAQAPVVAQNIRALLAAKPLAARYDNSSNAAMLTDESHCLMLHFGVDGNPLGYHKVRWPAFGWRLAEVVTPQLYWRVFLRGYWKEPNVLRKILHLGIRR